MDTPIGQSTLGEMLPSFVFIGILILLFIAFIKTSITMKRKQKELKNKGVIISGVFNHFNGLPIAENASCEVYSFPERLEFKSGAMQFTLAKEKVTDVSIKTDVEIQKQYVSSIGGAVGGAVLFGPIGAIIGGRAKEKKSKTLISYLIFTYMNEGEIKYIGFNVTNLTIYAQKFVNEFRGSNRPVTNVNL